LNQYLCVQRAGSAVWPQTKSTHTNISPRQASKKDIFDYIAPAKRSQLDIFQPQEPPLVRTAAGKATTWHITVFTRTEWLPPTGP